MSLLWVFAYLVSERLFELLLSRRHLLAQRARGGREFYPETFSRLVALHTDLRHGLTDAEVRSRLEQNGPNERATGKGTAA